MGRKFACNVIVCGPAIGKTYLAENDDRFIDLDEIKANYKYGLHNATRKEKENGKLSRGPIVNHDSTNYAIKMMLEAIKNNKIVLLSYNMGVIKYIIDHKIDYCLLYPGKELLTEYTIRMKRRGNSHTFISEMTDPEKWNQKYIDSINDQYATYKKELKDGEYLSDIKDMFFD